MSEYRITSHMSIEEAQEQGLTQIVKQLKLNESVRKSLGLKPHQEAIKSNHISDNTVGRPRKEDKVSFSTAKKMI